MRQPPEKLLTGASSCSVLKPRPMSSAWARERASKAPASASAAWASAMAWPSLAFSASSSATRAATSVVSPCSTKSVAPSSVSGMFWATSERRQWRGTSTSPRSFDRRPVSSANRLDLPAPLRPTRPIFSPGCSVAEAPSSTTLTPRRSVMSRIVIKANSLSSPAAPGRRPMRCPSTRPRVAGRPPRSARAHCRSPAPARRRRPVRRARPAAARG
mmetsp:Transcript_10609/g.43387  ORF Transcript_10609/g.43387 Transcript_10609/m.43387 type:complete len:215 (-) Transcript_10609:2782-3426(-)